MHSHSTAVMRPSLRIPILSRMSVSGRPRWVMNVSSRLITDAHAAAGLARQQRGDQFDIERLRAAAEAAADDAA